MLRISPEVIGHIPELITRPFSRPHPIERQVRRSAVLNGWKTVTTFTALLLLSTSCGVDINGIKRGQQQKPQLPFPPVQVDEELLGLHTTADGYLIKPIVPDTIFTDQ